MYDYRFSGKEQLVCNCGAASCRQVAGKVQRTECLATAQHAQGLVLPSRLIDIGRAGLGRRTTTSSRERQGESK